MTKIQILANGTSCYNIRLEDPDNHIMVHMHTFQGIDPRVKWLRIESRQLGLLIEEGVEPKGECE